MFVIADVVNEELDRDVNVEERRGGDQDKEETQHMHGVEYT